MSHPTHIHALRTHASLCHSEIMGAGSSEDFGVFKKDVLSGSGKKTSAGEQEGQFERLRCSCREPGVTCHTWGGTAALPGPGSPWCYNGFGDVCIDSGGWCKAKDIGVSLEVMVGSLGFTVGFIWDFCKVV